MDKILLDWHTLPYIDMTKPYWNQSVQEVMNINNVLLFNSSDFIIPDTETFFFSKRIAEDYSIPNLYETVLDGKWTWDLALEYIEKVTHDINGDGVMDIDDQYGYVGQNSYCSGDSMQVASGIQNIRVIDGEYVLDIEFDKLTTLFSKTTRLTNDNSIAFTWKYNKQYDPNGGNLPYLGVYTDRVLFEYATLSVAELYRASEFDFGIIPLPKFDEAQEQHWSLNTSGFMIIPLTVGEIELVGAVTELLSAENSRTVLPAFHEVLLKQKVSRDTDSEVMLDMIFENMIYTPSWNLSISVNGLEIGGNLSSYVASKETVWLKSLDDYNSWYADYETE